MKSIIKLIKKDLVLFAALTVCAASMLFVPLSADYLNYIDYKVIALLFCLMAVVAGYKKSGLFEYLSEKLLRRLNKTRDAAFALVGLCFFSAMLITNDVALITFVPLTLSVLHGISKKSLVFVIVLQTVAANLGSMLTPIGNPQNLYLYSYYDMNMPEFLKIVFPVTAFSLILIIAAIAFMKNEALCGTASVTACKVSKKPLLLYSFLFLLCILTVLHVLDYRLCLALCAAFLLIFDRELFKKVDYALLLTFAAFFVFVGNISAVSAVKSFLSEIIVSNELIAGIAASQIISNVPAAILLSGFTENAKALLLGVNAGGLGTVIASLASLISYKIYSKSSGSDSRLFMKTFTVYNLGFLAAVAAFICLFCL